MVCYWTVNTSECVTAPDITQFPESMSFGHMDSHTLTQSHTHKHLCRNKDTHINDVKGKKKWKKKIVAGGYSSIWRVYLLRLDIPAGKALKKNKHRREKASYVLHRGSSAVSAWFCAPTKREIYIQTRLRLVVWQSHWNVSGFYCVFSSVKVRVRHRSLVLNHRVPGHVSPPTPMRPFPLCPCCHMRRSSPSLLSINWVR